MAVPISNVTRRQVYSPSGAGGAGPYAFTFEILANTDIAVYKDDTLLTLTTHYTVTINSNGTGSATITSAGLALAPVSPTQYAIIGNRTISRSTDFTTGGDFFANTINDELDQQTIFAQQNAEAIQRSLTAPQTDPTTVDMTLPRASVRANKTLAFDSNGDPTTGEVIGDNRGNWASGTAYNKRDVVKDTSNGNIYYANTSHTSTGSQPISSNADVAKWDLLVDNASSAASATAAASSASAASTSASNASSSASAASTSASNASSSASTASTQASNAATSATAASGSATSAANSAAAAASALDSFDDRYLGTKTSDPTLDNDGNALATGALYFSTTANVMKVYDGASWIAATAAGATSLTRFRYVATNAQTTFSGADSASATLSYTVNNIAVHRNGVTLDTSEYTASNGTSIVLAVAAGTGDIIDIIAFKSFTVSDALSALTGGTVNGAVTITGVTTVQAGSAALPAITTAGDTNTGIFFPAADTIGFAEGGAEAARIDSSGNFGLGVTPSAWATVTGLQIKNGSVYGFSNEVGLYANAFYNGTAWKYIATAAATGYDSNASSGQHRWYNAASGTAGNTISFTTAMTLDASGSLLVGTTTAPTTGGLSRSVALFKQLNDSSFQSGIQVEANANTNVFGIAYNGDTFALGATYRSTGSFVPISFWTSGSERARILSDGKFLIGKTASNITTPGWGFAAGGSGDCAFTQVGANEIFVWNNTVTNGQPIIDFRTASVSKGNINWTNTVTTYNTTSDYRLKNTVTPMTGALAKVSLLKPCTYKWNADGSDGQGFIAHELQAVVPQCVTGEKDAIGADGNPKYQSIDTSFLVATLTAAIQEQQAIIESLTQRITALEGA